MRHRPDYDALFYHTLRAAIDGKRLLIVSPTKESAKRVMREFEWRMRPLQKIIKQQREGK